MKSIFGFAAICMTVFAAGGACSVSAETIHIARDDGNNHPFEYVENGKLTGFHIDLIRRAAHDAGFTTIFTSYPWKRAVNEVRHGNIDAISYISRNKQRSRFAWYEHDNYLSIVPIGFVSRKDRLSGVTWNGDLRTVRDLTIGVQDGFQYGPGFDSVTYLNKVGFLSRDKMVARLRGGDIDLLISDLQVFARKYGDIDALVPLDPPVIVNASFIAFSKAKVPKERAEKFAMAMRNVRQSPYFAELCRHYGMDVRIQRNPPPFLPM